MLKGDLATTSVEAVLTALAEEQATGCLHVSDPAGEEALVYLKNGLVYAVTVPGRRPQLGARLISSGALAPEGLADALEAQREELQGWRLGELLVHLGYVEREVVESFVAETVRDAMTDLVRWRQGRWRFRKAERTREDVATPASVADLMVDVAMRREQWDEITETVHGPNAVPMLSTRGASSAETTLDADAWSLLCKVDGERSIAELARDCGFTMLEAGQVVVALVQAGLVDVEEDFGTPTPPPEPAEDRDPANVALSLAAAFRDEVAPDSAPTHDSTAANPTAEEEPLLSFAHHDDFADSIARVSAALSQMLGPQATTSREELFDLPEHMRVPAPSVVVEPVPVFDEEQATVRRAAASELAEAHAFAEEERYRAEERGEEHVAPVVQLARKRRSARKAAAEGRKSEAAQLEEEAESARLAEEAEAARLAEEAEAARLAEEAEAARLAEEAEARRLAEEEEAARIAEHVRLAAEEARLAEEAEAARVAEEEGRRRAEEEEARIAQELRLAEEEAAHVAEETRLAEEGARLAEEIRLAEEAEATRIAAEEAENQRLSAAAIDSARIAAAALSELTSATADLADEPDAVADEPIEEPPAEESEFFPSDVPDQRGGLRYDEGLDTASLLRELSSLGLEDEPAAPPTPPATRPGGPSRTPAQKAAAKPAAKKRKGLFGR